MSRVSSLSCCAVWFVVAALWPLLAHGDALEDIRQRGILIWGADQEGGGPYVFPDPSNPEKLIGFEVELADMLGQELGVKAQFKQGQWDNLPLLLDGTIDIVLNGYELTEQRARDYLCSRPYYVYGLQLMARGDGPIKDWNTLRVGPDGRKWQVGALKGSAAETYLTANYADGVEVRPYDGNTDAMEQVSDGAIDATLQDDCIAVFYADRFTKLKFVGRTVGEGYYVALIAKDQARLHAAINDALAKVIGDGRLAALYDKWNMSGRAQMLALRYASSDAAQIVAAPSQSFGEILRRNGPLLLRAAGMTVFLSVVSFPLAVALGILIAITRLYGPWPLAKLAGLYVEVLRGTPLLLQLYAIFFLLPKIGIFFSPVVSAVLGLAINYSAYEAEIYRAGFQAVPRGQLEAALSLGMSRRQAIWRIILPQAFRIVIPPVTNDFIALFKDTAVCSVITVVELTKQYSVLALSTGAIVELAAITAVLYMIMSYPLSLFARWSERRMKRGELSIV
jgi:polar amino acid transport system substrate-binding protein